MIVTNMSRPAERVAMFYSRRGTTEQHIEEEANTRTEFIQLPLHLGTTRLVDVGMVGTPRAAADH